MIDLISLGIEGTAEKTGVGIVDSDGNILAMAGKQLFPEEGGPEAFSQILPLAYFLSELQFLGKLLLPD